MIRPLAPAAAAIAVALSLAAPAPAARPAAAKAVALHEKTALLEFDYVWPAAAAAIPKLDARLRADARTRRQSALNTARDDRKSRAGEEFPYHAHDMQKTWTVTGAAAGMLALRNDGYAYTGGAHGMSWFESILWDRKADRDVSLWSLFRDPAAAKAELARAFCPALNAERAKKRGEPVVATGKKEDDWLTGCPEIDKQVLIPSKVRHGRFTNIQVLIGPYEAGPYSEGSYELDLPVTARLAAMLKPERRGLF